jgi:ferric-dicitrate binding protein FerR (iron transport regulator)
MSDEEDVTAHLLRLAGAPPEPPGERASRVRQAVHLAWRLERRRRIVRRGAAAVAVCGIAAALLVAVRVERLQPRPAAAPDVVVATGTRIEGNPSLLRHNEEHALPLTPAMAIHAADVVETNDTSRASLQMADGSSLRLDRHTRIRFASSAAIELTSGAAYVETTTGSGGFEIRTAVGLVRDIGTTFEVRLLPSSLLIRVRAGRVQVKRATTVTTAEAGTEATVTLGGTTMRQLAPYASEWDWTAALAPPFSIEGRLLRTYLDHAAAERRWTVLYTSPEVAATANRTVLHGSVEGLSTEQALDVVLASSGLEHRLRNGELLISER